MIQNNTLVSYEEFLLKFKDMIKSLGLNNSVQREYVLKILFENDSHLSAEEILKKVKSDYKLSIGIATVYRILNLLEKLGVAKSIAISGNDHKVYELNLKPHHDHMVCLECNSIVEFYDAELERIQELVAMENGFKLQSHTMMLYGKCKRCIDNETRKK